MSSAAPIRQGTTVHTRLRSMGRELDWRSSFRFCDEFGAAVDALDRGLIDVAPLLTAAIPATDAASAFDLARDRARSLKVQITF